MLNLLGRSLGRPFALPRALANSAKGYYNSCRNTKNILSQAIPLTLLLPGIAGLGVDGVFLAEPISNLIGGVACFVTMIATIWPMLRKAEQRLKPE